MLSGFCLQLILEYCSAVYCSAADTHLKLPDRLVSGASFLTGCVFECDLAHRRSVAVLCMLYKIRCNPVHPDFGALPVPYVPVRITRAAVMHIDTLMRLLTAERRSISGLLLSCQYLYGTILVTLYSMVWNWRVTRACRANAFLLA